MVSAWPEQPSAKPAEPSARVDGQEAFVLCASETLLNWHLLDPKSDASSPSLAPVSLSAINETRARPRPPCG